MRTVSVRDARANFSDLLGSVYYTQQPVVVERKGKAVAVMVSPEQYSQLERVRHSGWEAIQRIQGRNTNRDPGEVLQDVTEVVERVRQGMHDEKNKSTKRGR